MGTYIFTVYSTVQTDLNKPNIITLFYNGVQIKQIVSTYVKHDEMKKIELLSNIVKADMKTLQDVKTVDTFSLTFKSYDKWGNVFIEITDNSKWSMDRIAGLINVTHKTGGTVKKTGLANPTTNTFGVNLQILTIGGVEVTSTLMEGVWSFNVLPGPISELKTYAELSDNDRIITAGETSKLLLYLRDMYNNAIPLLSVTQNILCLVQSF
jgi:hypothetical protein